ncbi:MAG TPA: hypothetical protein VE863_14890 [Pyrinomonadaceae bacterium]|jgi:hypothetical protein|nr:hypothetical protein [Pyrinomonadaceae bacterium]
MTTEDLEKQAQLIADSERKFVATIRELSGLIDAMIEHQSTFKTYLHTWRELFLSTHDLMKQHLELHKESVEALKSLSKALVDSAVTASENNDRIERLIVKMESYFGDGESLKYEN